MKKLLPLLILLSSCYTEKKATRQVIKAQTYHPEVVASLCGNMYPPIISTRDSIHVIKGETIQLPGTTITVNCDSAVAAAAANGEKANQTPCDCPPPSLRVDTFNRDRVVEKVNKAAEMALQDRISKMSSKNSQLERDLYWWKIIAVVSSAIIIIRVLIRIFLKK